MGVKVRKVPGKRWDEKDDLEKVYSLLRSIERKCVAMRHVDVSLPGYDSRLLEGAMEIANLAGVMEGLCSDLPCT